MDIEQALKDLEAVNLEVVEQRNWGSGHPTLDAIDDLTDAVDTYLAA